MLLDNLCLFLSLLAGFWRVEKEGVFVSRFFWRMVLESTLVNLVVMIVLDTYHSVLHHTPWDEMVRLLSQTGHVIVILLVFNMLSQAPENDMAKIARFALPLYILSCYAMRQAYKSFLKKKHHILNRHSLLIALETPQIPTVVPRILRSNYGTYRFIGFAILGDDPSAAQAQEALNSLRAEYPEVGTIPIVATTDT
jgi:hypothetical protein